MGRTKIVFLFDYNNKENYQNFGRFLKSFNFPFCYCSLESISETKLKGFTVPTEEEFKKAKNAHFKNAPARLAKQQAAN